MLVIIHCFLVNASVDKGNREIETEFPARIRVGQTPSRLTLNNNINKSNMKPLYNLYNMPCCFSFQYKLLRKI